MILVVCHQKAIELSRDVCVQDGKTVILIFVVHGSSQFHGVARVTNIIPVSAAKELLAPGIPATLQLEWWKQYV